MVLGVIAVAAAAAAVAFGSGRSLASLVTTPLPIIPSPTTSVPSNSGRITGKVPGVFNRNCVNCDSRLKLLIRTSGVWCAWRDGKVLVHVTMRNTAAKHMTVNWHPSYSIARGSEHGRSVKSSGFAAGELRQLVAKDDPRRVKDGSKIAKCNPSFSTIKTG